MLKKRIKKWYLERKHKHADMLFALRLALEREAKGKKTVFMIRGCLFTFEGIKHYFRRKGVRNLQSFAFDTDNVFPTTQIDCRTPEPERLVGRATNVPQPVEDAEKLRTQYNFTATNFDVDNSVVTLPDPDQVDRTIATTSTLGQVEQLFCISVEFTTTLYSMIQSGEATTTPSMLGL